MSEQVVSAMNELKSGAEKLNPDAMKRYDQHCALPIWTEGGEWPAYFDSYQPMCSKLELRSLNDEKFYSCEDVQEAIDHIVRRTANTDICAISMACGQGKSTTLVRRIHSVKLGMRTLVIQPSLVVAARLATYMAAYNAHFVLDESQLPDAGGIYYMNAGTFLRIAFISKLRSTDVIVMDEAHSATFTYEIVELYLRYVDNMLILMTASTSAEIEKRRHVKITEVSEVTTEVSQALAVSQHLIVGVLDNLNYATPANAIVGLTLTDLEVVYDTGLRPEPYVIGTELYLGERRATVCEITQTIGRLGRSNKKGHAFYNGNAAVMRAPMKAQSLYDILSSAIKVSLGLLRGDVARSKILWRHSGLYDFDNNSTYKSESTVVLSEKVASVDTSLEQDSNPVSAPRHCEVLPMGRTQLTMGRHSLDMHEDLYDRTDQRGFSEQVLERYWSGMHCELVAMRRIKPQLFPVVRLELDYLQLQETRSVLADITMPLFSEQEIISVLQLWNRYVLSLGPRFADVRRIYPFVKYFKDYYYSRKYASEGF